MGRLGRGTGTALPSQGGPQSHARSPGALPWRRGSHPPPGAEGWQRVPLGHPFPKQRNPSALLLSWAGGQAQGAPRPAVGVRTQARGVPRNARPRGLPPLDLSAGVQMPPLPQTPASKCARGDKCPCVCTDGGVCVCVEVPVHPHQSQQDQGPVTSVRREEP